MFAVCVGCFRGQCYCGAGCREEARRQQHSEANRRYQQTPEGRANHRRRQREYRERLRARVTDQATGGEVAVSSSLSPCVQEAGDGANILDRLSVCIVCGRAGVLMEGGLSPSRWSLF